MTENEDWVIEDDRSEEERRQYERYSVDFYLCVYEQERLLGHVIDVSMGGLRLLGEDALDANQVMSLRIEASLESGLHKHLEFQAKIVWIDLDEITESYAMGFEFLDLSARAQETLREIITELSN